jgi:glycosyltransferase involved in cell wall biosynthesis
VKVLHVIPSLSPARGGPSAALPLMASSLARAGIEVDIVTTDDDGAGRMLVRPDEAITSSNVTTHYHPRQTRFYTFSWPLTRWLRLHVRDYDLVHIHALFSYAAAPAAFYARRCKVPYVVRPLGTLNRWGMLHRRRWLKQASFRMIERRILAGAAAIHFTSEQEWAEAQRLGISHRSVVIPLGLDLTAFDRLPPPDRFFETYPDLDGRRLVLYLSRLDPIKGLDILLPAFRMVHERLPDTILVIAGDGEAGFVAELHDQAERLGIADHIRWTGFLHGEDKLAALAAATIFILPSRSESFGVAAVEAMASGLPVILSEGVGISEEVGKADAGLVTPNHVDALIRTMESLLTEPETRHRLALKAKRLAHDRFSLESTAPQLIQLYERIIRRQDVELPC